MIGGSSVVGMGPKSQNEHRLNQLLQSVFSIKKKYSASEITDLLGAETFKTKVDVQKIF